MDRIRAGPDWNDPEIRLQRHVQKVIAHVKAYSDPETFKDWLTAYLEDDLEACDVFDMISDGLNGNRKMPTEPWRFRGFG